MQIFQNVVLTFNYKHICHFDRYIELAFNLTGDKQK